MSFSDVPDYAAPGAPIQVLLATVPSGTLTADIALPLNVTALWIYGAQTLILNLPTVVGDKTGLAYPVNNFTTGSAANTFGPSIALVNPVLDQSVTVTVIDPPGTDWYVIGDTSVRVVAALPLLVPAAM